MNQIKAIKKSCLESELGRTKDHRQPRVGMRGTQHWQSGTSTGSHMLQGLTFLLAPSPLLLVLIIYRSTYRNKILTMETK